MATSISDLPKCLKDRHEVNRIAFETRVNRPCSNPNTVSGAFQWDATPEGSDFWSDVDSKKWVMGNITTSLDELKEKYLHLHLEGGTYKHTMTVKQTLPIGENGWQICQFSGALDDDFDPEMGKWGKRGRPLTLLTKNKVVTINQSV